MIDEHLPADRRPLTLLTWGRGGGPFPRIVRDLAAGLAAAGQVVDIVFVQGEKGSLSEAGVTEVGLGSRARFAIPELVRYFRARRPRLAVVTPAPFAPPALIAGRATSTAIVPWEAGFLHLDRPYLQGPSRWALPLARRFTYRWASAVAAVSSDLLRELREEFTLPVNRGWVIPNPISSDRFQGVEQDLKRGGGSNIRIVAAGRLTHEKGIDVLLKALSRMGTSTHNWRATILGDGPLRFSLQEMARSLEIADRIEFLGYVSNPYAVMADADLFVHPARWEGFGLVIVEAMALGIPVVTTTCPGGPKEILGCGTYGVLVPPEDPDSLAKALERLIDSPAERRRLSVLARARAQDYRPERVAERVLAMAKAIEDEFSL